MEEALHYSLDMLDGLALGWLLLAVFVFTILETSLFIGLIVSGELVIVTAGAATNSPSEVIMVVAAAAGGALLGQSAGFAIGRKVGPRIRSSFLSKWITEAHWIQTEALLARGIGPGVMVAHFLPVVHATLPVVAGVARLEYRRFAPWAGLAATFWALIYVCAGALFGQVARAHPSRIGLLALLATLIIVSLWLLGYLAYRFVARQRGKNTLR